jgi:hypothetical protein
MVFHAEYSVFPRICVTGHYCPWRSINVNVFLELVGLVSFTDRVLCWGRVIVRFHEIGKSWPNGKLAHHSGGIVYAMTSSMTMNESALNMHNGPHYLVWSLYWLSGYGVGLTEPVTRDRFPTLLFIFSSFLKIVFGYLVIFFNFSSFLL